MTFYHGTSDALPIKNMILPPAQTKVKREDWRKNLADMVFITSSLKSAEMYAKKAAEKYGGNPVVCEVAPVGWLHQIKGEDYIAPCAKVIKRRKYDIL